MLAGLMIGLFGPWSVYAAPTTKPAANGLNVVLVMDSSGSMRKNDPKELRKPAAKLFISLLDKADHVAIVNFSAAAEVLVPLSPAKDNAGQARLFDALGKIRSDGAHTNIKAAMDRALEVISAGPAASKSIVVLMSDGQMDPAPPDQAGQLAEQMFAETVKQMGAKKIEAHTIAFTDQSDKDLLERLSYATGGKFNIARSDKELHAVFADIFEQNKAPDMVPFEGGKFTIDSAVSEVTVLGSKSGNTVSLTLQSPSGTRLTAKNHPANVKWMASDLFDLITITTPEAGNWVLQASDNQNKAYILSDLKLQLEPSATTVLPGQEIDISAWLENEGKRVDQQPVLSSLTVNLMLQATDGKWYQVPVHAEVTEMQLPSGKYVSRIALPAAGKYHISAVVSTPTFSRKKSLVIDVPREEVVAAVHPEKVKKPPVKPAAHPPAHKAKSHGVDYGLVAMVFLGFNAILALFAGTWWLIKRRRRKSTTDAAAENVLEEQGE